MKTRFYRVTEDIEGIDQTDGHHQQPWSFHPGDVFGIVQIVDTPDNTLLVQTLGTAGLVRIFESQLKDHTEMIDEESFKAATSDLHVPMWEDEGDSAWKLDLPWHLPDPATIKEDPHEFDNVDWKAITYKAFGDQNG